MSELRYIPVSTDEGESSPQNAQLTSEKLKELTSLVKDHTPISKEVCDAVLLQLHASLRDKLNLKAILPYLNRSQILDAQCQMELLQPNTTSREKCDYLVASLQRCPSDYLKPFVEGLLGTRTSGIDTLHDELLCEIFELYKAEIQANTESSRKYTWQKKYCIITVVAIAMITLLTVVTISLLGIFSNVSYFQKESSQVLIGDSVIMLDNIHNMWVSTVSLRWNETNFVCIANVTIIPGIECTKPDFISLQQNADYIEKGKTLPYYALPNSSITVQIPAGSKAGNKTLRITQSTKKYLDFNNLDGKRRTKLPCQPQTCYRTNEHINSSVKFRISSPDFYYVFLVSDDGYILSRHSYDIKYNYNLYLFNYSTIVNYLLNQSLKTVLITDKSPHTVKVSENFKFGHPTCNLLSYSCGLPSQLPSLLIEDPMGRKDYLILIILTYMMCLFLLVTVILIAFIKNYKHKKKIRVYRVNNN